MGIRFRKSVKIGPVRLTASKSGISKSIGVKGFRVTKTASGRVRTTASIPGTGLSYVSESSKKKRAPSRSRNTGSRGVRQSPVVRNQRAADYRQQQIGTRQSTGGMIAKIAIGALFVFAGFSSPEGGWSIGYFFTALVIGCALIAWGLVPHLSAKKKAKDDSLREEALLLEIENEPKICSACGATSKGKICEYCGSKLK